MRRGSVVLAIVIAASASCAVSGAVHEVVPLVQVDDAVVDRELRTFASVSPADAFTPGTFSSGGVTLPYRMLAPVESAPGPRHPLVLVLHGSGAIGVDNRAQLDLFARSWAHPDLRSRFPAFVVVPQFAARSAVYSVDATDSLACSEGTPHLDAALDLVASLVTAHPVDPDRVYVVGFSMGGSSAWNALLRRPGLFAAAIPVGGVAPSRATASSLAARPILIVHGTADTENPNVSDRAMFEALRAADARAVRFREYVGLDHRVPPEMFADAAWREWLFAQRRPAR